MIVLDPVAPDLICRDSIPLRASDPIYTMVLTDDLTGDNVMDLVVVTEAGAILLLQTGVPYHPLQAWTSENHGRNGYSVTSEATHGIFFDNPMRDRDHIATKTLRIGFEIVDHRFPKLTPEGIPYPVNYKVSLFFGIRKIWNATFIKAGKQVHYTNEIPLGMVSGPLKIQMINEKGQVYSDTFFISFNTKFFIGL